MSAKVSVKDRILYLVISIFLILDLTRDNQIWTSKIGYYIQIVARIIACSVFAIIIIVDLVNTCHKLRNRKKAYSKKQIWKMIFGVLIDFFSLILFIIVLISLI